MQNRFTSGLITGSLLGVAIGTAMLSKMNTKQRKKVIRTSRNLLSSATDMMGDMKFFKR